MQLLAEFANKQVWYRELARPFPFVAPFPGEPYVCILFIQDPGITAAEQAELSDQIVRSGCRYAVCTGHICSSWDDSIDMAYLATEVDFQPRDETFVMTSWHDEEPLEGVIFFGLFNTGFDDYAFSKVSDSIARARCGVASPDRCGHRFASA